MVLSLEIAAISSIVATGLGTLIALALVRHGFHGRGATNLLVFLPMSTPEIVLGAALLTLFLQLKIPTGFLTIAIAHVMFIISYAVVTVKARLDQLRPPSRGSGDGSRRRRVDDLPESDVAADRARDLLGASARVRPLRSTTL